MTGAQRKLLILAPIALIATVVCPPWIHTTIINGNSGTHTRNPAGYALLAYPPQPSNYGWERTTGTDIDYPRLLIEWALVAAVVGASFLVRPAQSSKKTYTLDQVKHAAASAEQSGDAESANALKQAAKRLAAFDTPWASMFKAIVQCSLAMAALMTALFGTLFLLSKLFHTG